MPPFDDGAYLMRSSGGSGARPSPVAQASILPFDPSDSYGEVHTTLPPEQIPPPHFSDPAWIRADFNGVTIPGAYTPTDSAAIQAAGGVTMTSGRWTGLFIPFLPGANTTPPTMLMTPMLILYPRAVQDAALTEHAERAYDDMIFDCAPWNATRVYSADEILAWTRYLRSWGFRPVLWRGDPTQGLDAMLQSLLSAGVLSFYCHGEEVDRKVTSEAYAASLQIIDAAIRGTIPIGVHFTADGDRGMGYPIGFPRDTFLNDWSPYDGRVHLCQQLLGLNADGRLTSAGLQGASMWYGRQIVNLGQTDAGRGPGAPHSRVIAWETMATAQLYGDADETTGCRRSWELLCGTRNDPRALPVSGSANGLRGPDGSAV